MCWVDGFGFPRTRPKQRSKVARFQTGDLVIARVPTGKRQGTPHGRVAVRASGYFRLGRADDIPVRCCRLLQRADG